MLFRYLVTNRVRRALLRVLWLDRASGSVSGLARKARVSFAAAHKELRAMAGEGLAVSGRFGATVVYEADTTHPEAVLLRRLLVQDKGRQGAAPAAADRIRQNLAMIGAPLMVRAAPGGRVPALEDVLVEGLVLAHRDATVARVLPVALWKNRERLDLARLVALATRRDERQSLGFFLELTGVLGGDSALTKAARSLRDMRRRGKQLFFARRVSPSLLPSIRRDTPRLARKWGYLMDSTLESFADAFTRHTAAA